MCPAVQYGLLYTKRFEREKFLSLCLTRIIQELWISLRIFRKISAGRLVFFLILVRMTKFARGISSEKSSQTLQRLVGALPVAICARMDGDPKGNLHINALELKAVFNAFRCFAV